MAFDYPSSPVLNQVYNAPTGQGYIWNGTAWNLAQTSPQAPVASDNPPANPYAGQLWLRSTTGMLYIWYVDPNSSQWIQINSATTSMSQVLSLFAGGTLATSEVLFRYGFAVAATVPAGMSGSQGSSGIAATGSPVISIRKNNTQFGTATFTGTAPVFAAASATAFAIGDVLSVVAPATADVTLADVTLTIVAALG